MSEIKNTKVEFVDEDHIWVNNRQFISLKRFGEAKIDAVNEIKLLNDKNKELAEENEALKVLLKNQLDKVADNPLTEALTNKMYVEESDHEWECCGISTGGTNYICKKCHARKMYPCKFDGEISVTI